MENKTPVEFEGVTSKTYGLNVELPKNMPEYGYDDYMFHLNRGITPEERQQYFDTNIPYDVGLGIAARSKNSPKKQEIDKQETTFADNVTDALKGTYNTLFEMPASLGGAIDDTVTGLVNEYLYDDPEKARQATLKNQQLRQGLKDEFKLETKGTFWGEGLGSVGASTAIGVVTKANPLVMFMFGTMNYEENLQKMLEGGASFKEASSKAFFGGLLEVASEKFGFQVASKYVKGLLRKYAARFGVESFQEFWQEIKDQVVVGKYDTRSDDEMAKAAFSALLFGGLGGALGFAINDVSTRKARKNISKIAKKEGYTEEEAKEIGLSILDEKGKEYRQEVQKNLTDRLNEALAENRGNVYNALVKQGNDPVVAAEKAEELIPNLDVLENDIEKIVEQGFKQTELDDLKKDYDEAIRIGGDKAVVYMQLRDRVRELAEEAGLTEEESEGQEKILTSLFAQWYDKSEMSVDDFWNFLETRLELKDVINEPIRGEGIITQEQIDNELKRREQLETAMNIGKKAGRVISNVAKEWEERFGDYSVEAVKKQQIIDDFEKETYQKKISSGMSEKQAIIETIDESIARRSKDLNTEDTLPNGRLFSRVDRIQGAFDEVNNIIEIAKEHNPDVFLHEMSHLFFTNYMPWLEESGRSAEAKSIYKLVGKDNINEFESDDWEKITEVFLQYVRTGNAPNLIMEKTFQKAKNWIITQYRTISEDYEVSDEVKNFFDTLIADESDISELANVKTRIRDIENSIKQYMDNQQVTFKGRSAEDIKALKKAFHTRIPRKGTPLTEHLRKAGGIEPNSELAKQLGYDSKKKPSEQRIFKKGGYDSMDSLIQFMYDEGYISAMDYDTYEQRSAIEDEIENLISNSDYVFNEENSYLNEAREGTYNLQGEVAGVYDDIMKDLGIKDYDELEKVLSGIAKDITVQNKNIAKLNKDAIKYIQNTMKKAQRNIQKTEKDVEALKQKYADKLQKAKDKAERDNQKLREQQKERIQSLKEKAEAGKEKLIQQQRDKVKEIKQMQKIIDENQFVLQQELTDKIRGLPLNYAHQNDLLKSVAKVKDLNSYNKIVENVMQKAEEYADNEMKWLLKNSINKMLKGTQQKAGENKRNTYEGGKLFAELRGIQKMTQSEAQNELDNRIEKGYEKDSEGVPAYMNWTEADKLINRMLKYKAEGMKASTSELYDLALDLNEIIKNDIKERSEFEKLKSAKRHEMREKMASSLEKLKKGSVAERAFSQYFGDWHTMNNEFFGKDIADELDMLYEASNQTVYYSERRNFEDEAAIAAYGLKDKYEWLDKQEELKKPQYYIQRNDKKNPEKISKAQLMDLYLQMQNPETRELIMRNYEIISEEGVNLTQQIPTLLDNLTDQDKLFASLLAKKLQDDYDIENEAYIRRTGIDMPKVEGYFPRTSDYNTDIDTDYRNVALARPSYYKMRSSNAIPVFKDAIQKYREHIMEASYAVEMFDKYKEIYLTIMNSGSGDNKINIKDLIKEKYGQDGLSEYLKYLRSLSSSSYENKVGKAEKLFGKLVNNWIAKNIGLNAQVYAKQLISIINYSENMPYDEYFKNLEYAFTHPKEAKALVEKYVGGEIKSRFEKGLQNETVASVLNPDNPDRILPIGLDAKMKDLTSWFVRKGDITPIIFGGYARIKYMEEQGKSEEEIRQTFVKETNRSQQSSLSPSLSLYQKNAGMLGRIFFAFKNTALQYTRLTMEAVTQYRRGEISEKQLAKTIFTYMVAGRIMYEISANLLKGLAGLVFDDDKKKKEAVPSVAQWASFPIRFFTDAVPIVDSFVNNVVRKAGGGAVYSSGIGLSDDIWKAYELILGKKDRDLNDFVDGGLLSLDLFTGWGLSTAKRQIGYFVPEKKKKL